MSVSFSITLHHHTPEGLWSATSANRATRRVLGGLFTSAEAALAACWLTTDERITLPAIATYAQVRELLDARLGVEDADAVDDAAYYLASQANVSPGEAVTAVITEVPV